MKKRNYTTFAVALVTLALTAYRKLTSDALVNRSVASSLGAATGRWENLSKVENKGWEGVLSAGLYESKNLSVSLVLNGAINKNKLLRSGTPAINGSSFTEGYPLGAYWARNIRERDGNRSTERFAVVDDPVDVQLRPAAQLGERRAGVLIGVLFGGPAAAQAVAPVVEEEDAHVEPGSEALEPFEPVRDVAAVAVQPEEGDGG